jgi:hypothetical protein
MVDKTLAAIAFAVLTLCLFTGTSDCQLLGPPGPEGRKGELSISAAYLYYSGKWKSESQDQPFAEFEMSLSSVSFAVGYSFLEGWEAHVGAGSAEIEEEDTFPYDVPVDFNGDWDTFWFAGASGHVYRDAGFAAGPFVHAILLTDYRENETGLLDGGFIDGTVEFRDPWVVNLGFAVRQDIGPLSIYGGPVLHFTDAVLSYESTYLGLYEKNTAELEEEGNFGAYVGARITLLGFDIDAEGHIKSDFSVGLTLGHGFVLGR